MAMRNRSAKLRWPAALPFLLSRNSCLAARGFGSFRVNWAGQTEVVILRLNSPFKGAVSRYSVIFGAFFCVSKKWRLLPQVSRTSDYDRSVSRVNNFTAQAKSSKFFFSPEHLSFPVALPCCRHFFSPHKMAAKSHRLSSHCRYRQDLDFSLVFTDFFTTLYQKVEGSFVNIP